MRFPEQLYWRSRRNQRESKGFGSSASRVWTFRPAGLLPGKFPLINCAQPRSFRL